MSAAQHEAVAAKADTSARIQAAQYNPDASVREGRCVGGSNSTASLGGGCWSEVRNPTDEHLHAAQKYRKMAADHRAGSRVLRRAETRACDGVSDEDREVSPFDHTEDILDVVPLPIEARADIPKSTMTGGGALVLFRADRGMTVQWLQRVMDCHLARNAALGNDVPEMPACPLVPRGVSARVTSTDAGFAVAIRSDNAKTAQEILRRARLSRVQ